MTTVRDRWSMAVLMMAASLVFALAACGGSDSGSSDGGSSGLGTDDPGAGEADPGGGEGSNATATLIVGTDEYNWTSDDMNTCSINGIFPANADFGVPPSQGGEGPWVQFIDRGDGGINFSAVLDGREYSGTGSGEADEIRTDGFSYTGDMGSDGEKFEVALEVSC